MNYTLFPYSYKMAYKMVFWNYCFTSYFIPCSRC